MHGFVLAERWQNQMMDEKERVPPSLQEDVKAAVEYAEGQIRRLLGGQVELWELPLTGGLWRVTGTSLHFEYTRCLWPWWFPQMPSAVYSLSA